MPRVLLIEQRLFCEKHQEYYQKFRDAGDKPFWICLDCNSEEEKRESEKK